MFINQLFQNKIPRISLVFITILFWFLSVSLASAADLTLAPNAGTYSAGQTFTATIRAVPNGDNINAVEATLNFDPALLSVVSVSKNGSAFSLWTTEPTFSNPNGTIQFGGGSPSPFSNTSPLLLVTFRTVADGNATVSFSNASVLAADGRGTDVFETAVNGVYTIAGTAAAPEPTPTPDSPEPTPEEPEDNTEAIIFGDPPRTPEIGSPTFLDSEVWYSTTEGVFSWTLPFDISAVAIELSSDPDNVPQDNEDAVYDPPIEDFTISRENVVDGEQYVSINFENQVGWGAVLNRKLRIDTTAPLPFVVNVRAGTSEDSFPLLTFEANDETSGIDYYEMTVDDKEPFDITPDEAKLGYLLNELVDGTYTVKVVAYDMAGNKREGSAAVLITAGWIKPVEVLEETSFWDFLTPINLFIFFLLVVIALLLLYLWYVSKQSHDKDEKLRRETREIQDQMEKIFSALRDEIYDQILTITKRKRLSAKEKESVEALTQALEVSETLIEKEISDVKAILK